MRRIVSALRVVERTAPVADGVGRSIRLFVYCDAAGLHISSIAVDGELPFGTWYGAGQWFRQRLLEAGEGVLFILVQVHQAERLVLSQLEVEWGSHSRDELFEHIARAKDGQQLCFYTRWL